ncbi:hypothetical protein JCM33374_g2666 [Metschnikowia sp. JCM 33374]|nr:hypothetical protein JCM33374_g2666 [Metschnikowia sp. JCM 33374]
MSTTVKTANWRLVELGRVVLVDNSKLATIVEIIDQKRAIALAKVALTPVVLPKLPRGARTGTVAKKWAAADIDAKYAATPAAKKAAIRQKRASLSDFERFQVQILKKQRRYAVKKIAAK